MTEKELKQIFRNKSDCYADTIEVVQAMTEGRFMEVFGKQIKELEEALKEIFEVLDKELGDSDPIDDFTDDEIKEEYPLLWCTQRISKVINPT